jgi:hypothetical protein
LRDAQIGLLIAVPLIAAVTVLLYRAGALPFGGAVAAIVISAATAAMLFLTH